MAIKGRKNGIITKIMSIGNQFQVQFALVSFSKIDEKNCMITY